MKKLIAFISNIGIVDGDSDETILQKRFLVYQAVLMSLGGIIWGILTLLLNRVWQSSVPFGYVVLSIVNLTYFYFYHDFRLPKIVQTAISLLLPFLFQWVLGGFIPSGVVMLWALISLASSVTYQHNKTLFLWLGMYIVLTIISGVFNQRFFNAIEPYDAVPYFTFFTVLNIVVISSILFYLFVFVVRGQNEALRKLHAAQAQIVQSAKMATLGTLAAGVAHELNNPAAAAGRASKQLTSALVQAENARNELIAMDLNDNDRELIAAFTKRVREFVESRITLDPLERSDLETAMEDWLNENDFENAWELAPALIASGLTDEILNEYAPKYDSAVFKAVLTLTARLFPVHSLLQEISEGSGRISEIVVALKNYSFLGQAPIQQVNIHEGIDNTLVILKSKLKGGITVHKDYCNTLPLITAYGSELNQVWTNILDNAIDAMNGKGEITIRTWTEETCVVVEIEDNGPGIPAEIQSKIFDPFFTTKEPGKGTGLGLSTTFGIITEKHKGTVAVESKPGRTVFTIRIPTDNANSSIKPT